MQRSTHRILTTHAGNLRWWNVHTADLDTDPGQVERYVADSVQQQRAAGIDVVSDGEIAKPSSGEYTSRRLTNVVVRALKPGETYSTSGRTNDRLAFPDFYSQTSNYFAYYPPQIWTQKAVCSGPLAYIGQAAIQQEIDLFTQALGEDRQADAFMCVQSPSWIQHRLWNEYYDTQAGFLYALADAMKDEFEAIARAGFLLQIDDPALVSNYNETIPPPDIAEYRKGAAARVELLNHALADIPEDRIRYHVCWGSWHGPHTFDLPLKEIVDIILTVRAGAYMVEAGNVRHEMDWEVWQDVKLPDHKVLGPGVVSHATNVVETPELVAYRIRQYADLVGRERVIAATDCGMGDRSHPEIAWAKLRVLAEGARLATTQLW